MKKKMIVLGIISMFLLTCFTGLTAYGLNTSMKVTSSEIIVPDDYPTIQQAVDNAQRGDTIRVKPGTYYENVVVEITEFTDAEQLKIIGDNAETTIIDGNGQGNVVHLIGEDAGAGVYWGAILISGFTIRNSGSNNIGIYITSMENTIEENIIEDNGYGIKIESSTPEKIISMNIIRNNTIQDNDVGVEIVGFHATGNQIYHNNFLDNTLQAYADPASRNAWYNAYPSGGNYWNDYTDVDEHEGKFQNEEGSDGIWDNPYVIAGGSNEDSYPFVNQDGWTGNVKDKPDFTLKDVVVSWDHGQRPVITVLIENSGASTKGDTTITVGFYLDTPDIDEVESLYDFIFTSNPWRYKQTIASETVIINEFPLDLQEHVLTFNIDANDVVDEGEGEDNNVQDFLLKDPQVGKIHGVVKNAKDEAAKNVVVKCVGEDNNYQDETTPSGSDGSYAFENVPFGTYTISVERNGNELDKQTGITLHSEDRDHLITFSVSTPKIKSHPILQSLLDIFPNAFPLIRFLLKL